MLMEISPFPLIFYRQDAKIMSNSINMTMEGWHNSSWFEFACIFLAWVWFFLWSVRCRFRQQILPTIRGCGSRGSCRSSETVMDRPVPFGTGNPANRRRQRSSKRPPGLTDNASKRRRRSAPIMSRPRVRPRPARRPRLHRDKKGPQSRQAPGRPPPRQLHRVHPCPERSAGPDLYIGTTFKR